MGDIFDEIQDHIRGLYLEDNRREWCVLFSGGKDSSLVLTLIWQALSSIPPQKRKRPIRVISSNTGVETPLMSGYLKRVINQINQKAREDRLPITATLVEPDLKNRFFFKVLGRRTTPPSPKQKGYMWCNDHLKRKPIQKEIMQILSGKASIEDPYVAMFILGSREEESARRRINLQKYVLDEDTLFGKHPDYDEVLCYYPIKYVTNDELLFYLLELGELPFGVTFDELARQYGSSFAECGLQHESKQNVACGLSGSRSGCWVCPFAGTEDKMLLSLIEEGHEEYRYLLEWKKTLVLIRNDVRYREPLRKMEERKRKQRSLPTVTLFDLSEEKYSHWYETYQRASFSVYEPGPFTFEAVKYLLEYLLYVQEKVGQSLISDDEIVAIMEEWKKEGYQIAEIRPRPFDYDGPLVLDRWGAVNPKETAVTAPVYRIKMVFNMGESQLLDYLHKRKVETGRSLFYFGDCVDHSEDGVVYNRLTFIVCREGIHSKEAAKRYVYEWLGWVQPAGRMGKENFEVATNYLLTSIIGEILAARRQERVQKYTDHLVLTEDTDGQLQLTL